MVDLTDDEKHRIETEVLLVERVVDSIAKARSRPSTRVEKIFALLNTPFALTAIGTLFGGTVITLLGSQLEHHATLREMHVARQQKIFDTKHELIDRISEEFSDSIGILRLRTQLGINLQMLKREFNIIQVSLDGPKTSDDQAANTAKLKEIKEFAIPDVERRLRQIPEKFGSRSQSVLLARARAMFSLYPKSDSIVSAIDSFEFSWRTAMEKRYLTNMDPDRPYDELENNVDDVMQAFQLMITCMTGQLVDLDAELAATDE